MELSLNPKKTKVMTTNDVTKFQVDDECLEVVDQLVLLGSLIDKEGYCTKEVRSEKEVAIRKSSYGKCHQDHERQGGILANKNPHSTCDDVSSGNLRV